MNENYNSILVNQDVFTIDDAREAAKRLFEVQADDFYALKNEKWYKHLLNAITFGSDRKKKRIRDIRSLSKLQIIFMRIYCEIYRGLDSQLNELIENLSKTNESVKKLYVNYIVGVQSQQCILELSQLEQDILLLLLCAYGSIYGNDGSLKKYKASVAQTIGRGVPQGEFKPEMLEQVNKGDIFYRLIVEMCAVDGGLDDFSMPDNIYEAINYLTISNKAKENIENQIRNELNNFGVDYLINKYGEVDDKLLDEEIELVDEEFIDEEFSTIIIDEEINIASGSRQIYKNKEVFVHANVNCGGELLFDHCTIVYNDSALDATIKIAESGQLTITGSTIKCMSYKNDYFFRCNGNVVLRNCKLVDCVFLFYLEKEFYITDSELIDCADNVINVFARKNAKVSICNNIIRQNKLKLFNGEDLSHLDGITMIDVLTLDDSSKNFQFNNNVVLEQNEFSDLFEDKFRRFFYVKSDAMVVTQSSFFNMTGTIYTKKISECYFFNSKNAIADYDLLAAEIDKVNIDNCIFEKCENIISCGKKAQITNCQFVSCKNSLIRGSFVNEGGIFVEDCLFKNITNDFEGDEYSMWELFMDTSSAISNSALLFKRSKRSDSTVNRVHKCTFDGISMNKAFLIAVNGHERPKDETVVEISDCTFLHCETKRKSKKLIREYFSYYGAFNKEKKVHCTKIYACKGIEQFNMNGGIASDNSINFKSTYGRGIGASQSLNE
jgi:hypothetical protein